MTDLANAQRLAVEQRKHFEQRCVMALTYAGFKITDKHSIFRPIGVEVDIVVTNYHGISFYCTCKGSMRGDRPGLRRTDTVKKALCDIFLLSEYGWSPILLLASHVPHKGSGRAMLNAVERNRLFDILNPWRHSKRLQWLASASEDEIQRDLYTPLITLIIKQWSENMSRHEVAMNQSQYQQPTLF